MRAEPIRPSPWRLALPLLVAAALSTGCVYRMNVQQGNFLEAKAVDQVQPGMTKSQVRFLLGTPMVADSFRPDRWDYVYYLREGRTRREDRRHFVVWFENDKVVRIDRPDGEVKDSTLPASPGA